MKRIFVLMITAVALFAAGCSQEFDDSEIWKEIDSIKSRISALETVTNAYKNNLFIKSVEQIENGYIITFSDGSKATILNGKDGQNGTDGKDGEDGKDGQNGTDGKDGEDGKDGQNGTDGKDGETLIESIVIGENDVTFILTDGSSFSIPLYSTLTVSFDTEDLVVMSPNSVRGIHYTVKSILTDVVVEVTSSADIKAKVDTDDASGLSGTIEIKTGATIDEYSKVIVFVSNGEKVIMRSISFEEAGLVIEEDAATKEATAEGGEIVLEFLSNVECEVVIPEDVKSWISVVPTTRALTEQTITLKLEPNDGAARSAEVIVQSMDEKYKVNYEIIQEATTIEEPTNKNSEIRYTATSKVHPYSPNVFGANIISNEWNSTTKEGIITFDGDVTSIGELAFAKCSSLTSIIPPESITSIGGGAFAYCSSLTSIILPESITSIEGAVFWECSSLTSIVIPDSVTKIGDSAFYKCSNLTNVTIPEGVTTIEYQAFCDTGLNSITLPKSIYSIGGRAFYGIFGLKNVYCKSARPPHLGTDAFIPCYTLYSRTAHVPVGSLKAYKDSNWIEYATTIEEYEFD